MFTMMLPKKFFKPLSINWWSKISILFLFFPVVCAAQKPVFRVGLVGAINTTQVSGDDLWGFNQFGAYGGLCVKAQINEKSAYQFHIAFSQKGSRRPPDLNGNASTYILRLNYIDVPLIYSYRFQKNNFLKQFHGEVGMVNSYLTNYSERNLLGNVYPVRPFKKYEGSLLLGFGYWLKNGLFFSLRYVNSVLPIRKHVSGATYYFNRGQYNTVVQFSINYFFGKKSEE